jgi:hypothetical protein
MATFSGVWAAPPNMFFERDAQGCAGAVQIGFLSCTDDQECAVRYAKGSPGGGHEQQQPSSSSSSSSGSATVFKILLSKHAMGAQLAWVSQFPSHRERLFPPWTHLELVRDPEYRDNGVRVVTLRPTVFQGARTVDDVEAARRCVCVDVLKEEGECVDAACRCGVALGSSSFMASSC